jgi:hypothetical protein
LLRQRKGGASPGAPTIIDARHGRRPQSWRSTACLPQLLAGTSCSGTIWGPHVMHGDERSARLCTSRTAANQPQTAAGLRKRVTATYWGSSGRRFKSCQPDKHAVSVLPVWMLFLANLRQALSEDHFGTTDGSNAALGPRNRPPIGFKSTLLSGQAFVTSSPANPP